MRRIRENDLVWEDLDRLPVEILAGREHVVVHPLHRVQEGCPDDLVWDLEDRFARNFRKEVRGPLVDWTQGAVVRLSILVSRPDIAVVARQVAFEPTGNRVANALYVPGARMRLGDHPLVVNLLLHELVHALDNALVGYPAGGVGEAVTYATDDPVGLLGRWRRTVRPLVVPTAKKIARSVAAAHVRRLARVLGVSVRAFRAGRVEADQVGRHLGLKPGRWNDLLEYHPFSGPRATPHLLEAVLGRPPTKNEIGITADMAALLPRGGVPFSVLADQAKLDRWNRTLTPEHVERDQLRYLMGPTEVFARLCDQETRFRFRQKYGGHPGGRERSRLDVPEAACRRAGLVLDAALGELHILAGRWDGQKVEDVARKVGLPDPPPVRGWEA